MADKPFRVLLDLTDLHLVNFKYVWINVSPRELKTISDFKTALLRKIQLEREDVKLFVRDGLLLEQETIIVLREDDTIKVQYEEPLQSSACNSGKESRKHSRKRNCSDSSMTECNETFTKRCKTNSEFTDESKESNFLEKSISKPKKHKKSHSSVCLDKVVADDENLESNHNTLQCKKKKNKKQIASFETIATESNASRNFDSFVSFDATNISWDVTEQPKKETISEEIKPEFESANKTSPKANSITHQKIDDLDTSETFAPNTVVKKTEVVNNCPKKKRKRRKKRKHAESTVSDISHSTDCKFTSLSDNIESEDVKRKHIIYSPVQSEKDSRCNPDNVEDSPKDTFVINKNVSNIEVQFFNDYPKISTPAQSDGCGNPNWQVSLMQSKDVVSNIEFPSHKKKLMQDKAIAQNKSIQNCKEEKLSSEMNYDDLPPVTFMPKIGTCIAYKALDLDESYSPVISEYREGVVKNINPDTEELEIELLKHIIKPAKTGKFENLKKDELPVPEVRKCEILRWSDVISPKQLS